MLIRLLVVVLTLVGPMPFRVCNCAASAPVQTPADASTPVTPAPPKRCGCVRCAPPKDVTPAEDDHTTHAHPGIHTAPVGDAPHSGQHERDCPATNPTPLVKDAGPPPAPILPADCDEFHAVVLIDSWPLAGAPVGGRAEQPRPPKLPLYLTFLALRN